MAFSLSSAVVVEGGEWELVTGKQVAACTTLGSGSLGWTYWECTAPSIQAGTGRLFLVSLGLGLVAEHYHQGAVKKKNKPEAVVRW